ncbi:hypothetical protein PLICRDRAFT_463677 [Plicaturopsis crispa FD-325 SS-3]|nr:hypothetical protein PLICRDRAFT_463677 [Plicaturopsis crispa FD-325 SS-3]
MQCEMHLRSGMYPDVLFLFIVAGCSRSDTDVARQRGVCVMERNEAAGLKVGSSKRRATLRICTADSWKLVKRRSRCSPEPGLLSKLSVDAVRCRASLLLSTTINSEIAAEVPSFIPPRACRITNFHDGYTYTQGYTVR